MANNVIIKGLNATGKLIGRGYSRLAEIFSVTKICRCFDEKYTCSRIFSERNMESVVFSEVYTCGRAFVEP